MNFILFDNKNNRKNLLAVTFTRPVADLRVGIITIKEKWEKHLDSAVSYKTEEYLSAKFPVTITGENLLINGSALPDENIIKALLSLKQDEALIKDNELLGVLLNEKETSVFSPDNISAYKLLQFYDEVKIVRFPWDIFVINGTEIEADIKLITKDRVSQKLNATNKTLQSEKIFIEEGAKVNFATINASTGPVYIGKGAEVMEGAVIRGPFALCEHGVIKMSAKIYGPVTIGPYCKVGGEVSESVLMGYSNKAHDGFLGNAVIGEWCNLGADTNNSNLKNNYAEVKLWNYNQERFINTGLQFCGLIMGDHSKCGINTMFNTGTVVGVAVNIFGPGFPRNFIPSFSWGGAQGFTVYGLNKVFETAEIVLARRKLKLTQIDKDILSKIFEQTSKYRKY